MCFFGETVPERRKNVQRTVEKPPEKELPGAEKRRQESGAGACPEGYFYARNAGEIYATIHSLEIMARGLEHAVEGLEAALENFGEHPGGDAP